MVALGFMAGRGSAVERREGTNRGKKKMRRTVVVEEERVKGGGGGRQKE